MSEKIYNSIGESMVRNENVELGKLFGKPCLKFNGKAFACYYNGDMVFKLDKPSHKIASDLKGSKLFDPSGANRPMKEWVQVKAEHDTEWAKLANDAMHYISGISK